MRFLLDTNILSELRKLDRAHPSVKAWAVAQIPADFAISVISIMEIEVVLRRLQRRDPSSARHLEAWRDKEVFGTLGRRILPVDLATAREAARLHVPDPRPERDALIGATALAHGLTVVTRNVRDFGRVPGLAVEDWTAPPGP